jgi:hypothetical protein
VEFLPDSWHVVPSESGDTMTRRPRRNHTPAFKISSGYLLFKTIVGAARQSGDVRSANLLFASGSPTPRLQPPTSADKLPYYALSNGSGNTRKMNMISVGR